jgi:hypothetical protein
MEAVFLSETDRTTGRHTLEVSSRQLLPGSLCVSILWVWVLCYGRRSAGQSVLQQSTHLGLTTRSLLHVWQLRSCSCGAPSLTRGQVCPLNILLALASVVFLGSESLGTCDHILLSHIWDFPFRRLLRLAGSQWRYSIPPPHGCYSVMFYL